MKTVKDTQTLRQRYRDTNHILHVQFERQTSVSQSNLLYPLFGVLVHNDPKRQKMPKGVKMFNSKWHRKQRHFFIHPFRSLQRIRFVGKTFFVENKLTTAYRKWGRGGCFSTIPPFGAPLHFDWTKLAHAQLGYRAYNIRP